MEEEKRSVTMQVLKTLQTKHVSLKKVSEKLGVTQTLLNKYINKSLMNENAKRVVQQAILRYHQNPTSKIAVLTPQANKPKQTTHIQLPFEVKHTVYKYLTLWELLHKISILSKFERRKLKNSPIATKNNGIFIHDDH